MQNLRSTRRTELQSRHPDHVINSWLGQSPKVAAKHYLQVTDADWDAAKKSPAESTAHTGGPISDHPGTIRNEPVKEKARKTEGLRAVDGVQNTIAATPLGLEPRMSEPKSDVLPITPWGSVSGTSVAYQNRRDSQIGFPAHQKVRRCGELSRHGLGLDMGT